MPTFETKVEVYCAVCGSPSTIQVRYMGSLVFHVLPCNCCLEAAWHEGYDGGLVARVLQTERVPLPRRRVMPKFRKKPVVIEAVQLDWHNWNEICEFCNVGRLADGQPEGVLPKNSIDGLELHIPTLEGTMIAKRHDWIIRGIQGELYSCKPDIFEATYEPVEEAAKEDK